MCYNFVAITTIPIIQKAKCNPIYTFNSAGNINSFTVTVHQATVMWVVMCNGYYKLRCLQLVKIVETHIM